MKKIIATIAITLGLCFSVSAQYNDVMQYNGIDGFFAKEVGEYHDIDNFTPALPNDHNLGYHQPASVPLGSGVLLLAGLGLGYSVLRKRD